MNSLIICISPHHGNTEKIARAMAEVLQSPVVTPEQFNIQSLDRYDLIGLGSGIYYGKHHDQLFSLLERIPQLNKKVFIFSTSGTGSIRSHDALKKILKEKGGEIVADFACKGFDTFGPFKLAGGINKGCPDQNDLNQARSFAQSLFGKT